MSFHGPFHGFSLAFKISYLSNPVELRADFVFPISGYRESKAGLQES
jgi:hypothetical protein